MENKVSVCHILAFFILTSNTLNINGLLRIMNSEFHSNDIILKLNKWMTFQNVIFYRLARIMLKMERTKIFNFKTI
jgi:hypothetical protein